MTRRRVRLVPENAVEIFEVRMALFFDADGRRRVEANVCDPAHPDLESLDRIELRGCIDEGRDLLLRYYEPDDSDAESTPD